MSLVVCEEDQRDRSYRLEKGSRRCWVRRLEDADGRLLVEGQVAPVRGA